jgi:hypothetical protein
MDNKTKIIINYIIDKQIDKLDEESMALQYASELMGKIPDQSVPFENGKKPSFFAATMRCSAEELAKAIGALYEIQDLLNGDKDE